jgi:diaminopimelate decarboxylase
VEISYFDLGGGFGVPTVQQFDSWDYRLMRNGRPPAPIDVATAPTPSDYARGIVEVMRRFHPTAGVNQPTLVLEPGRALTSSAQSLVLQVLSVKRGSRDSPTVILDGGKNLALPTGYECHELLPVTRASQKADRRYNFFGPLCHPSDDLFVEKAFPPVEPGDLVAIMDAGAYFVPNQTNFSHARPPAVLVEKGKATLLRARESFEDIVMRDRLQLHEDAVRAHQRQFSMT